MIDEKHYEVIAAKCEFGLKDHFLSYDALAKLWDDYAEISFPQDGKNEQLTNNVLACHLYSIAWGVCSLSISNEPPNPHLANISVFIKVMLTAISNGIQSMLDLRRQGVFYQASIIERNQYELCFTLLNILIDEDKRRVFLNHKDGHFKRGVWRKNFSMQALNSTLEKYEDELKTDALDFLPEWRKNSYAHHTAATHNSPIALIANHYVPTDDKAEILRQNLWGHPIPHLEDKHAQDLNDLSLYSELIFHRALSRSHGSIRVDELIDEEGFELWDTSLSLFLFLKELHLQNISEQEASCKGK